MNSLALFATLSLFNFTQEKTPFIVEEKGKLILRVDEQGEGPTLDAFIKICEQNTGLAFVLTDGAKKSIQDTNKRIRMIGRKVIEKKNFFSFFQTILKLNDLVCIEMSKGEEQYFLIADIQSGNPATKALLVNNAIFITDLKELDRYANQPGILVTAVFTLKYQDASRFSATLRPYMTTDQSLEKLSQVGASGILFTSYGPSVYAVRRLIELIDVAPETPDPIVLERVSLEYVAAEEILQIVQEFVQKKSSPRFSQPRVSEQGATTNYAKEEDVEIKVIADTRTNSLLVQASKKDLQWVLDLIQQLDTKLESPESNFHVYPVKNVEAKGLGDIVQKFLEKTDIAIPETRNTQASGSTAGKSSSQKEQKSVVVVDERSNSLLITASKTKWMEIKNLLERLDLRQQQVLIETAIVELDIGDHFDLGVELADISGQSLPEPKDPAKPGFMTSFGLTKFVDANEDGFPESRSLLRSDGSLSSGQGILAGYITGGDIKLPLILSALKTRSNANVLSIPSVLVTNNFSALIESRAKTNSVQKNTANNGETSNSQGPSDDAGITLSITPSISAANYLRLGLHLEVSQFGIRPNPEVTPDKITRKMNTSVYVPNGATLYIGGIVIDNTSENSDGVPVLMDIPIIGQLFRHESNKNDKTTLYFFITPRIIQEQDFSDLIAISYQKKLEADNIIGKGKIQQIDPNFVPLKAPGTNSNVDETESQLFDIPIYRSPSKN